jgi:mRNA-degrading endonuclease toxin of MazEF toxin-antitoxin module
LPELGSVIWAELVDANGFRKVRPGVVVTATADIAAGQPVRVVAITTRLPQPLPDDHVMLPWNRQGTARSGLRRKCAAVASWQVEIPVADVRQVVGILPPATIGELLAKISVILPPPPPAGAEATGVAPSGGKPATPQSSGTDQDIGADDTGPGTK